MLTGVCGTLVKEWAGCNTRDEQWLEEKDIMGIFLVLL